MRDTGWAKETLLDVSIWRREITPATLTVAGDGRWWCDVDWEPTVEGRAPDLDAAKRAAEDALRDLCRQTLAALGDES